MTEGSLCLADLGYRGATFQLEMYEEEGVLFLTRAAIASRQLKILHSTIRTRVEGIFSSLWERLATPGLFKELARIAEHAETQDVRLQIVFCQSNFLCLISNQDSGLVRKGNF